MLRSFRVENHRSIRAEQDLALIPFYGAGEAVPVAAVYGANASGKSNLFDALSFMSSAVRDSFGRWSPDGGVPRQPFKLDAASAAQPSGFCVDFVLDGVRHAYGFTVDSRAVLTEWLHSYPVKRQRVLFEREGGNVKVGSTVGDLRGKLDVLTSLMRPNALFLSVAAQSNVSLVAPIYRFLTEQLVFRSRDSRPQDLDQVIRALRDQHERDRVVEMVRDADLGITDIELVPRSRAEVLLRDALVEHGGPALPVSEELRFTHSGSPHTLSFDEQAAGTKAWIRLVPAVLEALDEGKTLLLDEVDYILHPQLTAMMIRLFQDVETNGRQAQLVVITHDIALLGTMLGDDVLLRDQVWFMEKGADGASTLFPLVAFRPRLGENAERRYISGSYGGVPNLIGTEFANAVLSRRAS
ncbi:MAG TPA: AAA family ATPase [Kutzneria sp.]